MKIPNFVTSLGLCLGENEAAPSKSKYFIDTFIASVKAHFVFEVKPRYSVFFREFKAKETLRKYMLQEIGRLTEQGILHLLESEIS